MAERQQQDQQNAQRKGPKRQEKTRPAKSAGGSGQREDAMKQRHDQVGRQQ